MLSIGDTEQRDGLADAARAFYDNGVVFGLSPACADNLPDRADLALGVLAVSVQKGRHVLKLGIKLFVQLVRRHQHKAGVFFARLLKQFIQAFP